MANRKMQSALSGGLTGAGTGAQIGATFGVPGALIGGGAGLLLGGLGGYFTPDDDPNAMTDFQKQQLALEREKMNQDQGNFLKTFNQNKAVSDRTMLMQGLGNLAAEREAATAKTRRYNFRKDLYSAARGM